MHGWEIALAAFAAFVAITALVRLMAGHRDAIIRELNAQVIKANEALEQSKENAKGQKPKP